MDEIDLLRTLDADVAAPPVAAREAARRRLLASAASLADREARPRGSRLFRRLGIGLGAAGLAVALVFSLAVWPVPFLPRSGPDAAAAEILRQAADAAARQPALPATGYRHTSSVGAWMTYSMAATAVDPSGKPLANAGESYKYLQPVTREIWIAPDGSGRIRQSAGEPVFFSDQDRAAWVAAGSSADRSLNADFGPGGLSYANSTLPTDPVALRAVLLAQALLSKNGTNVEMFVLVGDALRETVPSPALASALFQVAATIDGVESLGAMADRAGRPGLAVGITGGPAGFRTQRILIFDPATHDLLGEEERVVETTEDGIPAESVIGYTTYLVADVVEALP
jgi:hypothetical protein